MSVSSIWCPQTKEASSVFLCVRISVTSRTQLPTITSSFYAIYDTFKQYFSSMPID